MPTIRSDPDRRSRSRSRALSVAGSLVMSLAVAATALGATSPMRWHRVNVHSDPPEHERFGCLVSGDSWVCRYDKVPQPTLGFAWDQSRGTFQGTDTTDDFSCPAWFPGDACASADTVVSGVGSFTQPRASGGFSVDQQLLVGDDGRLWVYWVDQFVCPWYPTFSLALAHADESFCVFAP